MNHMLMLSFGVAIGILGLRQSGYAHHGFDGEYDRSSPIYLEGVVTEAFFGLPHAELTLEIDRDVQSANLPESAKEFEDGLTFWHEGLGTTVEVELPPLNRFFNLESKIERGDTVKLIVLRNCEPPHQLRGRWVVTGDESTVQSGRVQNEVSRCQ